MIVAPNSPSARAKDSTAPDSQPGQHQRQRHPAEDGRRPGAQGGGDHLVAAARRAQRPLEADHQERQRHEGLREHDGGRGEGHLDAQHLEGVAEQPAPPERVEQGDAAHDRRQHQRQQDQGAQQLLPAEPGPGQHHGHRHPEDDAQQRC